MRANSCVAAVWRFLKDAPCASPGFLMSTLPSLTPVNKYTLGSGHALMCDTAYL